MIQLWRKCSRHLRSRLSITVLAVIITSLVLISISKDGTKYTIISSTNWPGTIQTIKIHQPDQRTTQVGESNAVVRPTPLTTSTVYQNKTHVNINPYPFHFTMLPAPCTHEAFVVVVHSAVQYFERRALMRGTWLNPKKLEKELGLRVKTVFITGVTLNSSIQQRLNYEQELYHDIVQSNFVDSYQNNTYKAISYLRWVTSDYGCPNASMLLKVDDDALIHPVKYPKLNHTVHEALEKLSNGSDDVYLGRLLTRVVNRHKSSKWYVSLDLWPHKLYPVWFQGLAYLMTPSLAAKLPDIALDTKYMFTDDVYVGILVSQVGSVQLIVEDKFGVHTPSSIEKLESSFRNDGGIFYHVPSVKHFIGWFNLDDRVISYLPISQTTAKHKRPTYSTTRNTPVFVPIIILLNSLLILLFICNRCF